MTTTRPRPKAKRSAKTGPRWTRRREARPAEIIEAALEVFAERGFAAARLDEVAARAGVSKGTVYLYFESKEELFKAVIREALIPNLANAERLVDGFDGPTPVLLTRLIEAFGAVIADSRLGAIPKLVIAEAGNFPDIARFYLDEVVRRGLRLLARIVERGVASGEFRPVPVSHAVRLVIAPVLFLALWRHSLGRYAEETVDTSAFLATHAEMLLRGLAPERTPGGSPR